MTPPTRRLSWRVWLAVAVVVLAAAGLGLSWWGEPDLIPVDPPPAGAVTIAGQLTLEPAAPAPGATVTARAILSADRAVVLRTLTVKVSDEAGAVHDFPALANVALGPVPREIRASREFPARGTYTYYLAYQLDGVWVSLPPWQRVTVR